MLVQSYVMEYTGPETEGIYEVVIFLKGKKGGSRGILQRVISRAPFHYWAYTLAYWRGISRSVYKSSLVIAPHITANIGAYLVIIHDLHLFPILDHLYSQDEE